jgi:pyruvate formate lyase activating enzyme
MNHFNMKASNYSSLASLAVNCHLCPHECVLQPGQTGICRSRRNVRGVLENLAYGNLCAAHIDPIEKKPLNHFLPGSKSFSIANGGCNLRCKNCQNVEISQHCPTDIAVIEMSPQQVVDFALLHDCRSISYTYTDPVVYYDYALETAKLARSRGLKNVLVSAGYINEIPLRDLILYVDAANIDLKSFDGSMYRHLCGASLLHNEGVWLEITRLMVTGMTDDVQDIAAMCTWLVDKGMAEVPLHLSRFYPHHQLMNLPPTPVTTLTKASEIAREKGMKYVYVGNLAHVDWQHTVCPECNEVLIERDGYDIVFNKIVNGKCNKCGHSIVGVWG